MRSTLRPPPGEGTRSSRTRAASPCLRRSEASLARPGWWCSRLRLCYIGRRTSSRRPSESADSSSRLSKVVRRGPGNSSSAGARLVFRLCSSAGGVLCLSHRCRLVIAYGLIVGGMVAWQAQLHNILGDKFGASASTDRFVGYLGFGNSLGSNVGAVVAGAAAGSQAHRPKSNPSPNHLGVKRYQLVLVGCSGLGSVREAGVDHAKAGRPSAACWTLGSHPSRAPWATKEMSEGPIDSRLRRSSLKKRVACLPGSGSGSISPSCRPCAAGSRR